MEKIELIHKQNCLMEEVENSIKSLKRGMGDLQKISGANNFYHAPILLLSSGYERLIKCLLCLALMDDSGEVKGKPYEISRGHELDYLLERLLSICKEKKYSSKFPAAEEDIDLLTNDKHLRKIISILSDFAQGGRYYNLDIVWKGTSNFEDPSKGWEKIETVILKKRKDLQNRLGKNDSQLDYVFKEINRELIITLEKFTRALARLFIRADFGDFAKRASTWVTDYLLLRDDELGTTDYRDVV
ncbi:hypothetical protein GOV13_04825 [Candidatus Pacearchaeota archaeon]|nr:hypothetical protein [Candidatus Pacearchaeota archaeon]